MANRNYKNKQKPIKINKPQNNSQKSITSQEFSESIHAYAQSLKRSVEQAQMLATLSAHNGSSQPYLEERFLQDMNFNPAEATSDDIEAWLLAPQYNDRKLRALSQYLEYAVGQYNRFVHYFADILSFNCMLLPGNSTQISNSSQKSYQNSYRVASDVIAKAKPKQRFRSMALATMQDGVSIWHIEKTENDINFLQLPTDWCIITSKWAYGWTASLDLAYFDRMAYIPNIIPNLYNQYKLFNQKRKEGLDGKALAPYQYLALDPNETFVLTFDPNKALKIPPLSNTFGSALDILSYRQLLKDKSALELWKVLWGKIPQKKNTDEMIMPYEEAADIVEVIQSTLPSNMTMFASPFDIDDVSTAQASNLDNIVSLSNDTFYAGAGTTGTFFGDDDTKSAKAITINARKDYLYVAKALYPQFELMMDWQISNATKTYSWVTKFSGNDLERDEEINTALKLTTSANFPIQHLASAAGYLPHELEGLTLLENAFGLKSAMQPLTSQFQASKNANITSGRDKMDTMSLSDEGIATRDSRGQE